MTRYKRHIFRCTALDFVGIQDALLADGAVWTSYLGRFSTPEVGVLAIIVDDTGQMTYTCHESTIEKFVALAYSTGGFSVETKRFYTLDDPVFRPTLHIDGKVYDKADTLKALEVCRVRALGMEGK